MDFWLTESRQTMCILNQGKQQSTPEPQNLISDNVKSESRTLNTNKGLTPDQSDR